MSTIFGRFREVTASHGSDVFVADIKSGQVQRQTYSQILDKVQRLAASLQSFGLTKGDGVAILLPNSADWVTADLACAQLGLIVVPIHTTYSWNYIQYTIKHSGSVVLILDTKHWQEHKSQIITLGLKKIIIRGEDSTEHPAVTWQSCLAEKPLMDSVEVSDQDIHTIVYTSGTTADPKGVMLTHDNVLFDTDAARQVIPISSSDSFFSFLPLSHMLERTGCYYTAMSVGASIYFASSTVKIAEEVTLVRPTIMLSVPRMFDKMYEKIFDTIDTGPKWKKRLFFSALKSKQTHNPILKLFYDLLVFKKIRAKLGGRLRLVVSGGASLDRQTARFFQTIGLNILEGYGLTETSPVVAVNHLEKVKIGTVGLPLPGVEVTIGEDKEILIRGRLVMKGYYHQPEADAEAIDGDGWFHSGDMGFVDKDRFLTVIGRAKELIVMSNGKKVNPVPVEITLNRSKYISQSMVYGDHNSYLSALIVPDFKELTSWLNLKKISVSAKESLQLSEVNKFYAKEIAECLKDRDHIEQIKDFRLISEEFSEENDMMTPTQKLKRGKIVNKHDDADGHSA